MNYVWETLLTADAGGIGREEVKFVPARNPSPYVEVSFQDLNTAALDGPVVEVNPLYRFHDIFAEVFGPDVRGYETARTVFLDAVMHYMAETDLLSGMHKQEYFYWFLLEELQEGVFGEKAAEAVALFDAAERRIIVASMLGLYRSARYKELFIKVIKELYGNAIIYAGKDRAEAIYLYVGREETVTEQKKIRFLADTFLPVNEDVRIFYDRHFGIMDVEETMVIGKTLLI